ncbi:MAG: tetratricopeptide repeat protein [Pedosphaera sp.]|nr:tetratricopeptide repeat protein [Pedosphaera sp.]MSU42666.1 tetratricopeptide repeat protein [Pedosphaera sp.]
MLKPIRLEPPDTHHLSAAEGWMDLGNFIEAQAELEKISEDGRQHFNVLQVQWHIHNRRREWDDCLRLGREMIVVSPRLPQSWINCGNALFYLGQYDEAYKLLFPKMKDFPNDEAIPYNLACYKCQSGDLKQARALLQRALRVGDSKRIRNLAMNDPDLEPLWKSGDSLQ